MRNLFRFLTLFLLFALLLPATPVALAQDFSPQHTDPGWQAFYWNNPDLSGAPVVQRFDNDLNFDWGLNSPGGAIPADNFSARWDRYIDVTPGTYRFTVVADDGIRVFVDNELIINQWRDQPAQTYTAEKYLGPGHHLVRVEYYERTGGAVAKLSWTMNTPGPTPTPTPVPPPAGGAWRGDYFNNLTLSGAPALVRNDPEINFDWGGNSPAREIAPDGFSVRWTRNLDLPAGNYRFTMTVDDGARLFVNGHTLIDAWREQGATPYAGDIYLPGGTVTVQMEYFESRGGATARLNWQQIGGGGNPPPITDWQGEYYNNRNLSGTPVLVRNDRNIDFDWGGGSPAPGTVSADDFSVRWTRTLDLPAGNYRFIATTDDGVRLFVSGQSIINNWREQSQTDVSGTIYVPGGRVAVQMEYFDARGGAIARLRWAKVDAPQPTPPPSGNAVIVDDRDPGFVRGGDPTGWRTEREGYGNTLTWSKNNDKVRPNYNWSRWYPNLRAGRYEVFVYLPHRFTTTANARYWVSHQGGLTLRPVNQSAYSNEWVSLGVYTFRGTRDDYVSLADVTFEPRLSLLIAWDAVKWEPR
jgi:hypothetical protein